MQKSRKKISTNIYKVHNLFRKKSRFEKIIETTNLDKRIFFTCKSIVKFSRCKNWKKKSRVSIKVSLDQREFTVFIYYFVLNVLMTFFSQHFL